jgi:hypothetical protein
MVKKKHFPGSGEKMPGVGFGTKTQGEQWSGPSVWLVCLLLVHCCPDARAQQSVMIPGIPHVMQKPDFCGEACAEMYLKKLGSTIDQDDVFALSGTDPLLGRGCYTRELDSALRNIGFHTGDVWYTATAQSQSGIDRQWRSLHADLVKGVPSIVCMNTGTGPGATEHFRLVAGYDSGGASVVYHEPAMEKGAYRSMRLDAFLKLWPLRYNEQKWTLIRLRLEPGELLRVAKPATFTKADFAQHILALKGKLAGGFTVLLSPLFVVIGNGDSAIVRHFSERTVQWAVAHLKKLYFEKDPTRIIDVWLFKDEKSYLHGAKALTGGEPTTPFGYYLESKNALIMNIATGGGTLVHEIVHPFIESNFPACPAWLNEGLGSLYEQAGSRGDTIIGLTNWRLAGLKKAIRKKKIPEFKTLLSTSNYEFYMEDEGTNYAQARYLCYYLQEKGLLVPFYHTFREHCDRDSTGYATLRQCLGNPDMPEFQKRWEQYVLDLEFRD